MDWSIETLEHIIKVCSTNKVKSICIGDMKLEFIDKEIPSRQPLTLATALQAPTLEDELWSSGAWPPSSQST